MSYCKFCEKEIHSKTFSQHLKINHNVIFLEYVRDNLELFPSYHICPVCNENVCGSNLKGKRPGTCSNECKRKIQSIYQKGRKGWSKGLTKTDHPGLMSMAKKASNRKGVNIWDRMDEKTKRNAKRKISEATSKRCKGKGNPMYGKTHAPESIRKIMKKRPMTSLEEKMYSFLNESGIDFYF